MFLLSDCHHTAITRGPTKSGYQHADVPQPLKNSCHTQAPGLVSGAKLMQAACMKSMSTSLKRLTWQAQLGRDLAGSMHMSEMLPAISHAPSLTWPAGQSSCGLPEP